MRADDLQEFLDRIRIRPRRLQLVTPGVQANISMLRGVWGAALHRNPAIYHSVFSVDASDQEIPQYLLRPTAYDPQCSPALDWFLFPKAFPMDDELLQAWQIAANTGLGPKRIPFQILEIKHYQPDGTVAASQKDWSLAECQFPLNQLAEDIPCRLNFPTALRLRRQGKLIYSPTFTDIIVAICRRVELLLGPNADDSWQQLKRETIELSRSQRADHWRGNENTFHRYSARQKTDIEMQGVSGHLDLPEGSGALWPLLNAASWIHLGKGTVFGLGQLQTGNIHSAHTRNRRIVTRKKCN